MSEAERDIKHAILAALGQRSDMRVWNHPTGVARTMDGKRTIRFGLVGSGDICGILAPTGQHLWIETKSRTGQQREQQERFERMVLRHGGIYILARSVEECISQLPGDSCNR